MKKEYTSNLYNNLQDFNIFINENEESKKRQKNFLKLLNLYLSTDKHFTIEYNHLSYNAKFSVLMYNHLSMFYEVMIYYINFLDKQKNFKNYNMIELLKLKQFIRENYTYEDTLAYGFAYSINKPAIAKLIQNYLNINKKIKKMLK